MNANFWKGKKCLITGITGFVGSHLARRLVKLDAEVIGITRRKTLPETVKDISGSIGLEIGDIEDYDFLHKLFEMYRFDTCFHLAASAIVKFVQENPLTAFKTNITGTWNMLEVSRRHMTTLERLIVASSDKAYGQEKAPYDEKHSSLIGLHPYDCSKACADLLAQTYFVTYGLPVRITRCSNIYGEGDPNESRVIPSTILRILRGEKPIVHKGRENYVRECMYVGDAVNAYLMLAEKMTNNKDIERETLDPIHHAFCAYNVGAGEESKISVIDLVRKVLKLMGKKGVDSEIDFRQSREPFYEIKEQFLSTTKFRRVFEGWEPMNLDDGLKLTIEWHKDRYKKTFGEK